MQKTTFYVLPIHIYCINTYINIFYIQQPLIWKGDIQSKGGEGWGGSVCFSLIGKWFVPLLSCQSDMQMWCVCWSLSMHTHHKCSHLSWPSTGSCRSSTCWLGSSAAGCWTGRAGSGHPEHANTRLWNFGETLSPLKAPQNVCDCYLSILS